MLGRRLNLVERYIWAFVEDLVFAGTPAVRVRRSDPLPVLDHRAPPAFDRFRNGLRGWAALEPEPPYRGTRAGTLDFGYDRRVDGQWYQFHYRIHLCFGTGDDHESYVELRPELISREPGPDPALCL